MPLSLLASPRQMAALPDDVWRLIANSVFLEADITPLDRETGGSELQQGASQQPFPASAPNIELPEFMRTQIVDMGRREAYTIPPYRWMVSLFLLQRGEGVLFVSRMLWGTAEVNGKAKRGGD